MNIGKDQKNEYWKREVRGEGWEEEGILRKEKSIGKGKEKNRTEEESRTEDNISKYV